jgi:hypothetical protein
MRPDEIWSQWLTGVIPKPPDSTFNVYALTVCDRNFCSIEHMQRPLVVAHGENGHLTFALTRSLGRA